LIYLVIMGRSIKYEVPHCATSPILLLLLPSLVQILNWQHLYKIKVIISLRTIVDLYYK
jgi:hypothetical protein